MKRSFTDRQVGLKTRELFKIKDGQGLTVASLDGVVWITQANDPRDVVVKAGQCFALDRPGLALIYALSGPASVSIRTSAPCPPARRADVTDAHRFRFAA